MKSKIWAAILSLAIAAPSVASADTKDFGILILDDAEDGCWTNVGEAKTYAEDKLRQMRFTVDDALEPEPTYLKFRISVFSRRSSAGSCFGAAKAEVLDYATGQNTNANALLSVLVRETIFESKKANEVIFDTLDTLFNSEQSSFDIIKSRLPN